MHGDTGWPTKVQCMVYYMWKIYTTKIMEYVWGVCVCSAMRFVMLQCMGLKLGMGIEDGPPGSKLYFQSDPTKGQRSSRGQRSSQRSKCLRNALWLPNLVRRTPDQSVMHCWGHRSYRGQPGSTRGQFAQKWPMATKFGRKNPWPKHNALLGFKGHVGVRWGQVGVNLLNNALWPLKFVGEPLTRA